MSYASMTDVSDLLDTINSSVTFVRGQIRITFMTHDDINNGFFHMNSAIFRRPVEMNDLFWGRDGYIIDNRIPYAFLGREDVVITGVHRI